MSLPSGVDPSYNGAYKPDGKGGWVVDPNGQGSMAPPPGATSAQQKLMDQGIDPWAKTATSSGGGATHGGTKTGSGLSTATKGVTRKPTGDATPVDDLTGPQRNAFEALKAIFESYDLGSLAPKIREFLVAGYDADTISYMLQQTDEWKQRFAGNETRKKNGIAVLSAAEYLATERAYRQVLVAHGAPEGFYDKHSDFADWIGNDVSASEIDSRAKVVSDHLDNADPNWMLAAKQFYNIDRSTAWAYFLDPAKGADLVNKRAAALSVGAAAMDQGLSTSQTNAEALASMGVTETQAQQGYGQIGQVLPTLRGLGQISDNPYTQSDAEQEVFQGLASATRKRRQLTEEEASRFSGQSGSGSQSFSSRTRTGGF